MTLERSKSGSLLSTSIILRDITDSRDIGAYDSYEGGARRLRCYVNDMPCESKKRWNELLSPYMEQ